MDFLKICRTELDRLIEQSPPIPEDSILLFQTNFGEIEGLKKPDICGSLEHTRVFESSDTRLKQAAVDAAILLRQKKHALTELMSPHIQASIQKQVEAKLQAALEEKRQQLEEEIERKKRDAHESEEEAKRALEERQRLIYAEIDLEKKKLVPAPISMTNVADMQKRRMSTVAAKHYFIKNSAPKPVIAAAIDHHTPRTPRTPRIPNSPLLSPMLAPLDSVNIVIQPDPNANLYDKHE